VQEEEERRDPAPAAARTKCVVRVVSVPGGPLQRAYVAGRLWMDGSQEHAHGCLRNTLWRMPRLPVPVVEIASTHVAPADLVGVDARESEGTASESSRGARYSPPPDDVEQLARAGELLPDWYDDWILEERDWISCAASPWRSCERLRGPLRHKIDRRERRRDHAGLGVDVDRRLREAGWVAGEALRAQGPSGLSSA